MSDPGNKRLSDRELDDMMESVNQSRGPLRDEIERRLALIARALTELWHRRQEERIARHRADRQDEQEDDTPRW